MRIVLACNATPTQAAVASVPRRCTPPVLPVLATSVERKNISIRARQRKKIRATHFPELCSAILDRSTISRVVIRAFKAGKIRQQRSFSLQHLTMLV